MSRYIIKSKELLDTIPAGFPHPELVSGKWETWVFSSETLDLAINAVLRQKAKKGNPGRPLPERKYRIYLKDGRKLTKVWED